MKHQKFTDEIGDAIVVGLKTYWDKKHKTCSGQVLLEDKAWVPESTYCYRYTAEALIGSHPDHFGIPYQGWTRDIPMAQRIGKEALLWMTYLVNPDGPFREILPYLYHTEAKQICKDRGVVLKDICFPKKSCNAGLLWTFLQATRYMFENPVRMKRFLYLHKNYKDKSLVLYLTLALQPVTTTEGLWTHTVVAHGEPLGSYGYKKSKSFLAGKLSPSPEHHTTGSHLCFDSAGPTYNYNTVPRMPIDQWVNEFTKGTTDVAVAA